MVEKEAILWNAMQGKKVECVACARRCKIPEGSNGFCWVRKNLGGKLYLMNYGVLSAMQIDPIEKKPFNHFMPGTYVFGVGTSSCNWGCQFCQNHNISKDKEITGVEITPERLVGLAVENNTESIAFTYNEPTIFIEYALDVARLAHRAGLKTLFVTNGYMTKDTVAKMKGLIDAAVVDFKGNGEEKFANKYEVVVSNEPIKEALIELKRAGIHVELTDLIIPGVGDSLEACDRLTRWVHDSLGPDTPIQFTQFHPDYKMLDYPLTSFEKLKRHYGVAKRNGLNYVYVGNLAGNPYENTYCPECDSVVVERNGHYVTGWNLDKDMKCKKCGHKIPIVGPAPRKFRYEGIRVIY
ncbi:MAG: AmmeMemoRadiSam system radical SAM enzyme [Candidatus Marsarchaeota archaeon]|jgi:pyruvate formate lyase activating enzyme|nr:AmmeMemoRadiSam system radical SAM enzyme [Candidatus Marsarchaeota archaeon]MCL5111725.1 AmmeMemoRadiSam system radical SAM enzyme [Candidatus Marsarchaeota archaeon]